MCSMVHRVAFSDVFPAPDWRRSPDRPCQTWLQQVEDLGPRSCPWISQRGGHYDPHLITCSSDWVIDSPSCCLSARYRLLGAVYAVYIVRNNCLATTTETNDLPKSWTQLVKLSRRYCLCQAPQPLRHIYYISLILQSFLRDRSSSHQRRR